MNKGKIEKRRTIKSTGQRIAGAVKSFLVAAASDFSR